MKLIQIICGVVLSAVLFYGCTKDEKDEPTPILFPETPPNHLCDGKPGDYSYFPLVLGNKWVYTYDSASFAQRDTFRINGVSLIAGKTYYNLYRYYAQDSLGITGNIKLRMDATNKNVFQYNSVTLSDELLIPGNPTVGQSIGPDPNKPTVCVNRKVISITGTDLTAYCNYTGCIVIERYGIGGGVIGYDYYKRGLGMVSNDDYILKEVVLK
ncbi:MAG: hypothetical protein JNL69_09200 [Bacteroidia bacterium]|nr:hypothetical protein [Bacteroidia bacterium]